MNIGWNFSPYNYGRRQGISDSGVETFKKDRYGHLAKEICQNSLDALKKDEDKVKIDFQYFEINKEDIPGHERYLEVFEQCYNTSLNGSGKVKNFFSYTKEILEEEKIKVLRISDFNTTGLTGSKEEKDTPWNDLIKAAGISNKGGDAGGSFGIGKYAVFACSNLRTIFYSTCDEDGVESYQGVSEVINFIDVDGLEKNGEGYYGNGDKNLPIFKQLNLDPKFFRAQRTGTDIYVLGFIKHDDWIESIVYSIIDSFLISIYNDKLEVRVGNILINKENLKNIIENKIDYSKPDRDKNSFEFYKVLTSKETIINSYTLHTNDGEKLGEFKVYLLVDNELSSRRVLMSRINGMKVFEQSRFPKGIPFSGICILKDRKINDYFRRMETPEHNAWKADQFSENPKEIKDAKETRLNLIRIIREELNRLARETTLDETDVGDLGILLPDLEDDLLGSRSKDESLSKENSEKEINIKIQEENKDDMPVYIIEDGVADFNPQSSGKGGGRSPFSGREGVGRQKVKSNLFKIKMFQINQSKYRMHIKSNEDLKEAELILSAVGEDKRTTSDISILDAFDKINDKKLEIRNKYIVLGDIKKDSKLIVDFTPDIIEQLSMEVTIYEN